MHVRDRGTMWFVVSMVMVAMVFVVLEPARSSGLRFVDIVILFFGGFAAGASFMRGIMLRRHGQ